MQTNPTGRYDTSCTYYSSSVGKVPVPALTPPPSWFSSHGSRRAFGGSYECTFNVEFNIISISMNIEINVYVDIHIHVKVNIDININAKNTCSLILVILHSSIVGVLFILYFVDTVASLQA